MFETDFILREIQYLTRMMGKVFFEKDIPMVEIIDEEGNFSENGLLRYRLKALVYEKKINEAENLLFKTLEQSKTKENLEAAIEFYKELQSLDDTVLIECNFSREEIMEGLKEVKRLFEE